MEDQIDSNLLIIIAAVLFSIISGIAKQRSNSAKRRSQQDAPEGQWMDDAYIAEPAKPEETAVRPARHIAPRAAKAVIIDARETEEMPDTEQGSEILDGFSLRDAIIYSELLKPKFEE